MIISRVFAKDFLSYESLDVSLENLGTVLIDGENRDCGGSNGAGKTSIFEAVVWCLYGKTTKQLQADEVIRRTIGGTEVRGQTCVYLEMFIGDSKVEVYRHRRHKTNQNKMLLFVNGKGLTRSTDKETQALLDSILGIDYQTFVTSVFLPQTGENFADMSDATQKEILDKILRTERYSEAKERLTKKISELIDKTTEIGFSQTSTERELATAKVRYTELCTRENGFATEKSAKLAEFAQLIQAAQSALAEFSDEQPFVLAVREAERQLAEITKQASDTSAITEHAQLVSKLDEFTRYLTALEGRYGSAVKTIQPEVQVREQSEINTDSLKLGKIAERRLAIAEKQQQLRKQIDAANRSIASKASTTLCNACGQKLDSEAKERLFGSFEGILEAHTAELAGLDTENDKLLETKSQIEARLAKDSEKQQLSLVREASVLYAEAVGNKAELERRVAELSVAVSHADSCRQKIKSASDEVTVARDKLSDFRTRRTAAQSQIQTLQERAASVASMANPYVDVRLGTESEIKLLGERLSSLATEANLLDYQLRRLRFWETGFGRQGVRSLRLAHSLPALTEFANRYMDVLFGGEAKIAFTAQKELQSGEKWEALETLLMFPHGEVKLRQLSGGEQQRVHLATMLALGDLASSSSRHPIRLRMLDEPFDGLDANGAEQVVQLLAQVVEPIAKTVLVMTHDDNLKSVVPKRLTVVKQDGVSSIL